jgi:hypothetical protein
MTEEFMKPRDYAKGFNEGYILAEHMPVVADNIAKLENQSPRIEGMKDGREQFVLDKFKEMRAKSMQPVPARYQENTKSKDIDIEPEH